MTANARHQPVAKLKVRGDIVIECDSRRDEYATDRGRGAQQDVVRRDRLDRVFAFWFRRLVYTQIWEDPEADLAALQLPLGSTIVTISSGGCNALSYLRRSRLRSTRSISMKPICHCSS